MLIGFCGIPGVGKSTAARYLHDQYGFAWINVGDPMKEMLRGFYESCGLDDAEIDRRLYGDLKRVPDPLLNGKTPTYALQTIGYEWRDLISPALFADRWGDRIARVENAVSDGMRYPDEMPVFERLAGTLVRIDRPGLEETTGHPAENQTLLPHKVIVNDGSIDDLLRKVDSLIS